MATGRVPTTANSPLTAKGDLFTYSTAPARLAVGNNGESLVADSSTSTGLRYQSAYNGNGSINGGMDIWQRGTSFAGATTNTYCADRWIAYRNAAGSTFSRQTSGLTGFLYSTRIARDSGNTSILQIILAQMFESQESYKYAGQTVTLSWYAKAGANFSGASNQMLVKLITGTGTDQNWIQTGYTGQASTIDNLTTITTSWVRYQASVAIPSGTTEISLNFGFVPVGTAGANDWVEVTGVQLELGSVATTFKRAGGTLQGELAACQRYFERMQSVGTDGVFGMGVAYLSNAPLIYIQCQTTKRVTPSVSFSGTWELIGGNAITTLTSPILGANTNTLFSFQMGGTATGMTQGDALLLRAGTTDALIDLSSEL